MKKVININFQGRVIPIEETAFEQLKQYIESLRRYFAREEGRDEIINDIESRIAELFSERLKKGAVCITDADVNEIAASMGRPEDFDAEGAEQSGQETYSGGAGQQHQQQSAQTPPYSAGTSTTGAGRGRFYRNPDDKILGGVASGLANYLGIDPVILRIVFVVFVGALFWVYLLLWIIVPSRSMQTNITKRLYRSADDKVISGVCGGLAAYFNVDTWIPRIIFALPLIVGLISGPFNFFWDDWGFWEGPRIITGSLTSVLFITYIILWIAVPVAVTASEKLEMRGEKVDLNSIRDTVKEDLEGFKAKAEKWGSEVKQSAQQFGQKAKEFGQTASSTAKTFSSEAGPAARSAGHGIGHAIGVLFKAFFLFIAAILLIVVFTAFIGVLTGGFPYLALKEFILTGFWQNLLAWSCLLFFVGVPIVALITWLIRRVVGVRTHNKYLGWAFGSLWTIGLISTIFLASSISHEWKTAKPFSENVSIISPRDNKLNVDALPARTEYYGNDWFGFDDDEHRSFYAIHPDTIMLRNIRIRVAKSEDSAYHVNVIRFSHGRNPQDAIDRAKKIQFNVTQENGTLMLPNGFPISRQDKFRTQQVLVIIDVPVGKKIELDRSLRHFDWFDFNYERRGWNSGDRWDERYWIDTGKEYIMTDKGPRTQEDLDRKEEEEIKRAKRTNRNNRNANEAEKATNTVDSARDYRYNAPKPKQGPKPPAEPGTPVDTTQN